MQLVPSLVADTAVQCLRCATSLRRARSRTLDRALPLYIGAVLMLLVMCTTNLLSVEKVGMVHHADLLSGPEELVRRQMAILSVAVVFTTLLAPFAKLLGTIYVLVRLREPDPPRHLRRVFVWVQRLSPWAMIDVFVFGVLVAYVKLGDLVSISLAIGAFALLALTFVITWADAVLDRHAVWEAFDGNTPPEESGPCREPVRLDLHGAVSCHACDLVCEMLHEGADCPRCGSVLHARKPDTLSRTWALLIAAAILYVPANYFPVLTVVQLGAQKPSTIIGGVRELWNAGLYPLAALVLFASILVPVAKIIGLGGMLIAIQTGRVEWLRGRTRLYFVIKFIGRWSMIDIFMESLLGALVRFGTVATITPGLGAIAFCAVVVLTMFAAESFDPRLMWDVAERKRGNPATNPNGYSPGWNAEGRSGAVS